MIDVLSFAVPPSGLEVSRQMVLQTSLAASAIRLVASGLGVSIVDPFTANYLGGPDVVTRPFKSSFRFEIVAARPSHHQQSRHCREFIEIMIDLFKKQAAASITRPMRGA